MVLLHGGGVDNAELSWGGLGDALSAAGHRVLAPDHPGFGQTPLPDWTITQERLVEHTGRFIDAVLTDHQLDGPFAGPVQWLSWASLRVGALGEISVPTLVVHGSKDTAVTVRRAVEAARALPDTTLLVVEGAGHWVQRDRPDRVVGAVVEFLRRVPGR